MKKILPFFLAIFATFLLEKVIRKLYERKF